MREGRSVEFVLHFFILCIDHFHCYTARNLLMGWPNLLLACWQQLQRAVRYSSTGTLTVAFKMSKKYIFFKLEKKVVYQKKDTVDWETGNKLFYLALALSILCVNEKI